MDNPWIFRVSSVLLVIYYIILSLPDTWIGQVFVYLHLGSLIDFVVHYSLIILVLLLLGILSKWVKRPLYLLFLAILLYIGFYYKIVPRLIV